MHRGKLRTAAIGYFELAVDKRCVACLFLWPLARICTPGIQQDHGTPEGSIDA